MEYKNFENYDDENREQKPSFIDDREEDDDFQDAEDDDLLFNRDKDLKGKLPFTPEEKRAELKRYFRDSVYNDSESRIFLDNLQFQESGTADNEIEVLYKGTEIGTIDPTTKTLTRNTNGIKSSGYEQDYRKVVAYRNSTLIDQIEETTGEQGFVNDVIAENVKKNSLSR